ncbi:MAG TPA: hypothetical protein VME17_25930 [Bryobacteraceae bacterium]|nr:hypothetical protein [Bryobacteraceae bacterium]
MHRNRFFQAPLAALALAVCTSTLHALPATPLIPTYTPTGAVSLTYQLPGTPGPATAVSLATAAVASGSATNTYFTVDPTTVPYWLSVDTWSGTIVSAVTTPASAGTPVVIHLQGSGVAATLGAGIYTATVQVDVIGDNPLNIPVTLTINNPAASLSVSQGNTVLSALTWSVGSAQAPFTFTLVSNSVPISYTTTLSTLTSTGTTVATGISIAPASGIVYTWGTTVSVTLSPLVYAKAVAGDVLSATVTVNYGTSSNIALTFQLTVLPPVAAITSLYPAATPVDTTTTDVVNVVITGTGFVPSGTGQVTEVFANSTQLTSGVTVVNSTTIVVAITVGTTGYFSAAGTPLVLAVINPNGGSPSPPSTGSGVANLNVVSTPIIDSVTSASTFIESGANAVFAPYDFITIFGNNFCPDCGGSNPTLLSGAPDSTYYRYPTFLSPDSSTHFLQVQFNKHSGGTLIAQGYLVFASNTQINVLVPSTVTTVTPSLIGSGTVDIVVSYGTTAPPAAPLAAESSAAYTVGVVANDPGIFAANSDGTGQGAVLNSDYSLNSSSNAALHTTGSVIVYMTGLGAPTSTASNATTTTAISYPGSCISALGNPSATPPVIGYLTTMNTTTISPAYTAPSPAWTTLDGAIIQSAKIVANGTYHYPPCLSPVTATIAGISATVTYAGWVADSIAGLYQVNITVPAGAVPNTYPSTGGSPISVPVLVTVGGKTSQTGVTLYVK